MNPQVIGIYRRSFRPTVAECEQRIVDEWYSLCARQQRDDRTGARISEAVLHDLGVFLQRARRRERPRMPA